MLAKLWEYSQSAQAGNFEGDSGIVLYNTHRGLCTALGLSYGMYELQDALLELARFVSGQEGAYNLILDSLQPGPYTEAALPATLVAQEVLEAVATSAPERLAEPHPPHKGVPAPVRKGPKPSVAQARSERNIAARLAALEDALGDTLVGGYELPTPAGFDNGTGGKYCKSVWGAVEQVFEMRVLLDNRELERENMAILAIAALGGVTPEALPAPEDLASFLLYKSRTFRADPHSLPLFSKYKGDYPMWVRAGKPAAPVDNQRSYNGKTGAKERAPGETSSAWQA